ncbi:MAG: ABC transporter substrate-binding protein [Natronospirillum sp.]|nr:ABC transporter substrate-binding protein [Natronospirillum sp.]
MLKTAAASILTLGMTVSYAAADSVVVSSKIDTEGSVIGNIIYLALQDAGIQVEDRIQLGATNIVRDAIAAGEIDIYPEYTGNGAFFFDEADSPDWNNADTAYERVKELDYDANKIVWLRPAPANNTWAISVREDLASSAGLETLEDLADYLNAGGDFRFAGSAEFVESPSALPAFQEAYGFELSSNQLVVLAGGNTAATMRAAAQQTDGVNAAMTYGTDGGLQALQLRVLEDTLGVQPVYEPAPIIRESVLQQYPEIEDILAPLFAAMDLETLQQMNGDVAVNGLDPQQVARDFIDRVSQ